MSNVPDVTSAEEVTDELIRATLRDQAKTMGRIKLPKRGFTKPALTGSGPFAVASRDRKRTALELRSMRRRWLANVFTKEEIEATRQYIQMMHDMMKPKEAPPVLTRIADAIKGVFNG